MFRTVAAIGFMQLLVVQSRVTTGGTAIYVSHP